MGNFYSGEPITAPVPGAPTGSICSGNIGEWNDGYCNDDLNNIACGYDGGDCCPSTCSVGRPGFGLCTYTTINDCIDPNAEENGGLKLQVYYKEENSSDLEVTVTGAQPGSTVLVWASQRDINPFVIPDDNDYCPGLEVDVEFDQRVPQRFIADDDGQVRVNDVGKHYGRNLESIDPVARCSNLFQALEVVPGSFCKKSDVAFLQEWRPLLWDVSTCSDHGFQWCYSFACPEPIEYNNCCQSPVFWCDVAAGCSADHNGTPDDTTGPDVCRAYWLANEYFYSVSGLTRSPTVSPRPTDTISSIPTITPTVSSQPSKIPSSTPSSNPSETCVEGLFEVEIQNNYSYNTRWELLTADGNTIISEDEIDWNAFYQGRKCVDYGCYKFVIYNWDGLCNVFYGTQGYYTVSLDGIVLQEACEFDDFDTVEFCVGTSPSTNPSLSLLPSTSFSSMPSVSPSTSSPTLNCEGGLFILELQTDNWGYEISWNLVYEDGTIVNSGDGYGDNELYEIQNCLNIGCYRFIIYDSYGDGIYSPGYYTVTVDGAIVGTGGDFDDSDIVDFCYQPS